MPTYHRSQRLRLVGTGPKVEQLQEGRFRLTFTCTATNPNEAWMNGNKDQIMTAYGTLQSAQKNIAGIDPRTDEAYSDMVLFRTEANPSERDLIITLVYETATTAFVKAQDDKIDFELNGLKRVTRVTIAKTGTALPSTTIGSTTLSQSETDLILASKSVEENDAFIQITEVYLEQGTVSESVDNVGSQLAKVITTFGADPDTPDDYVLASKEESNFAGYQTNTFRFLKNDVQLSNTVDNESPLLTEVQEWFNPASENSRDDKDNYVLTNKTESNVDGIPTERYTFKKTGVILSQSYDKVGSQQAVVISKFGSEPTTGEANTFGGENYAIAKKEESGTTNQKTFTYTFLQKNVTLSISEDLVGSQKAIVIEKFGDEEPVVDDDENTTGDQVEGVNFSGYSIAKRDKSNLDGIETYRYTYLKDNAILSTSEDKVGSQKAVVIEKFGSSAPATGSTINGISLSGYSLAKEEESNISGIKTFRYTFLKPSILSVQESKNTPENRITVRVFNLANNDTSFFASSGTVVDSDTHILVSDNQENFDGIKTSVYVFECDDYFTKTKNEFGRTVIERVEQQIAVNFSLQTDQSYTVDGVSDLKILNQRVENDNNLVKRRITTFTTVGIDDVKEEFIGSQRAITITKVGAEPTTAEAALQSDAGSDSASDFTIARKDNSRASGLDIYTYTFMRKNSILSETEDKVGSQQAIVKQVFDGVPGTPTDYIIAREEESNLAGIPTKKYTFLKPSILSVSQDFVSNEVTVQAFNKSSSDVTTALSEVTSGHSLISQREQDHDGIPTQVYVYQITSSDLIDFTADDRLQVSRTILVAHDYDYDSNYTVGTTTATVNSTSVTLTSLRVDTKGASGLMRLTAIFTEPKIISISAIMKSEYNDTPMYQYRSLVSSPKAINTTLAGLTPAQSLDDPNGTDLQANAVFAEPNVNNTSSPVVFTQNVLNTSVDLSVSGSSALISSHEDFYDFQMPGLITLSFKKFGREATDSTSQYDYNKINIETKKIAHPITTKVKCSVFNFIQRGSTITESDYKYAAAQGLWSPDGWAAINMKISKEIYGFDQVDVPINSTYPGYRIEGASRQQAFKRKSTPGFNTSLHPAHIVYNGIDMGSSFFGMKYELNIVNNGPPNPERKRWCLNVDIQPAFRDTSGNQYYNKQIVVTERIPTRTNGSLIYN